MGLKTKNSKNRYGMAIGPNSPSCSMSFTKESHIQTLNGDWQLMENKEPLQLSLILQPRSSKKWYTKSFIEPRVSKVSGRNVYAVWISAYFSHFLAVASSAIAPHLWAVVATWVCQGAYCYYYRFVARYNHQTYCTLAMPLWTMHTVRIPI